jgi:hypothetical protein
MNALKADPRTVDLRSLAPHFYRLGVRILELFEEEEMVDILIEVLPPRLGPASWMGAPADIRCAMFDRRMDPSAKRVTVP